MSHYKILHKLEIAGLLAVLGLFQPALESNPNIIKTEQIQAKTKIKDKVETKKFKKTKITSEKKVTSYFDNGKVSKVVLTKYNQKKKVTSQNTVTYNKSGQKTKVTDVQYDLKNNDKYAKKLILTYEKNKLVKEVETISNRNKQVVAQASLTYKNGIKDKQEKISFNLNNSDHYRTTSTLTYNNGQLDNKVVEKVIIQNKAGHTLFAKTYKYLSAHSKYLSQEVKYNYDKNNKFINKSTSKFRLNTKNIITIKDVSSEGISDSLVTSKEETHQIKDGYVVVLYTYIDGQIQNGSTAIETTFINNESVKQETFYYTSPNSRYTLKVDNLGREIERVDYENGTRVKVETTKYDFDGEKKVAGTYYKAVTDLTKGNSVNLGYVYSKDNTLQEKIDYNYKGNEKIATKRKYKNNVLLSDTVFKEKTFYLNNVIVSRETNQNNVITISVIINDNLSDIITYNQVSKEFTTYRYNKGIQDTISPTSKVYLAGDKIVYEFSKEGTISLFKFEYQDQSGKLDYFQYKNGSWININDYIGIN